MLDHVTTIEDDQARHDKRHNQLILALEMEALDAPSPKTKISLLVNLRTFPFFFCD
jgi:hypothetical protein